nr:ABC transporter ATP-binding protein [Candidatus Paceibacterota bacterium]
AIHEALQKLHGTMTMIIIAHRLTTVMETDKIIVVDKGNIAEEGAPQELLKDENSYFYRLTHLQE